MTFYTGFWFQDALLLQNFIFLQIFVSTCYMNFAKETIFQGICHGTKNRNIPSNVKSISCLFHYFSTSFLLNLTLTSWKLSNHVKSYFLLWNCSLCANKCQNHVATEIRAWKSPMIIIFTGIKSLKRNGFLSWSRGSLSVVCDLSNVSCTF